MGRYGRNGRGRTNGRGPRYPFISHIPLHFGAELRVYSQPDANFSAVCVWRIWRIAFDFTLYLYRSILHGATPGLAKSTDYRLHLRSVGPAGPAFPIPPARIRANRGILGRSLDVVVQASSPSAVSGVSLDLPSYLAYSYARRFTSIPHIYGA